MPPSAQPADKFSGPKKPMTAKTTVKTDGTQTPKTTKIEKEIPTSGPNGEIVYPSKVPTPWFLSYKLDRKIEDFPDSKLILDSYPGSYVAKFPNMGKLHHPLIRCERIFLEQEAMRNLFRCGVSKVMDVGGSVKRASSVVAAINKVEQARSKSLTPVFTYYSCNPTITSSDVVRNQKHKDFLRNHPDLQTNVEWKTLQNSTLVNTCDALLFNHSLYYFGVEEVFDAMVLTTDMRGLAITHVFKNGTGSFPGATYVNENGTVNMIVEGNSFPYNHPNLSWLTESNAYTKMLHGSPHTMCWSVIQQGVHTSLYQFVIVDGSVEPDMKIVEVEEVIVPEAILAELKLTYLKPGPLGVFIFQQENRSHFSVIPALVKYAKDTCFMGKKPDVSAFRQAVGKMRSVEAEKLVSAEVRESSWYSAAFIQSMVVAFLECAFEYNAAQSWVAELMPMIEKMTFGVCVKRELAVTEKLTNAVLMATNGVKTVGEACGMDVSKDSYITDEVNLSFGKTSTVNLAVKVAGNTTPIVPVVPFRISADPDLVQKEVDARVKSSKANEKIAIALRKTAPLGTVTHQNILAVTSIKRFMSCKIRENVMKRTSTPWCFSTKLGPPLLPNSQSTASIASAKIHRLFDGKEHLDSKQTKELYTTWAEMSLEDYLPGVLDIAELVAEQPLLSSRDWLEKQYGRRNDAKAVANLEQGIQERETTGKIHHDFQLFVKQESALAKGNTNKFRGIFVADPTYASYVNPFYHQVMKSLCKTYHPNGTRGHHTVISAGLTAAEVGAAIGNVLDTSCGDSIIIEMDASSYEANQTKEHTMCVVNFYKGFNPPPGIIAAIEKMYDVKVIESVDLEGNRKLSFYREGGMASGIGDVSLRNSLNTIMARWCLLRSVGYKSWEILKLTYAMILGDDNWVIVPRDSRTETITPEYVTKYFMDNHGWKMKCNIYSASEYTKSEFCSMYPFRHIPDDAASNGKMEWGMSLKPGRFFSKTLVTKTQVERGMDTLQQLKGMVCGAGHFTNGWLMSRCLLVLYKKLSHVSLDGINFDHDFAYQPTYKYNDGPIAQSGSTALGEDCDRYDLTETDLFDALRHFVDCASDFPNGPLIITKNHAWDTIIQQDMPFDETDFSDDLRLDHSQPDLKEVRHIPKEWYKKGAEGHYDIYPAKSSMASRFIDKSKEDGITSLFGLEAFLG